MNDYREVRIDASPCSEVVSDLLAALLCDIGYESFVPDETGVTAYIRHELFDRDALETAIGSFPISGVAFTVTDTFVEGRDWNHEWEKNYFQPIVVGDNQCVIHSSFHQGYPECRYDIVIDPKMAFGTGHHSTTSLIIGRLLEMQLDGCSMIDMGTGTGILAILAAMRGATPVTAIEIDPMAHINAVENVAVNGHSDINVLLGDASLLAGIEPVDLFLANINRNIILADIGSYVSAMKPGARILLSGFYETDVPVIMEKAAPLGLRFVGTTVMNDWCCLELILK